MRTALVVDDEPFVSEVIGIALEDAGFQVISAANGREGLAILDQHQPVDVIITDNMMPALDGPEMVRIVRSKVEFSKTPIILISAIPCIPLERYCPGADKFLQKPFSLDEVVDAVAELLPSSTSA